MKVTVLSPWYPNRSAPYSGIFVEKGVEAVRRRGVQVEVEIPTVYPAPSGPIPGNIAEAMELLAGTNPGAMFEQVADTTWIPSPVPARSGHMGRASAFASALALKRRHIPKTGELTHAHLGVPTGWAALAVGDTPVVVTEHQSTLGDILSDQASRAAYREVVEKADAFICVSYVLKKQLGAAFGFDAISRIQVIPNVVDLADIPFVPRPTPSFSSWIYVGGLTPGKGVQRLLETFSLYRKTQDRGASLTLVGGGPLRPWVDGFVADEGLEGAVRPVGARPHTDLGGLLALSDVMVHLSEFETFGISCLEAIGSGLPVVSLRNGGAEATWGEMESECGLLMDLESSPAQIVQAIARLRDDPGPLDARAGRVMVENRYSPESVGSALLDVYGRCLT